jgi:DNA-binding CsgD family transcriptional regulator
MENLRERERVLCRMRNGMAVFLVAMTILFEPAHRPAAVLLAVMMVALSAWSGAALRGCELGAARRLGRRITGADAAIAVAIYLLFMPDPAAMPVAFVPFVVFELSLRFGHRGATWGLALFVSALAARVGSQLFLLHGTVRPPLLLLWAAVGLLMVVVSRELRTQEEATLAALTERERIASGFRATLGEMLSRSHVPAEAATRTEAMEVLRRICEERSDESATLAAAIADLVRTQPEGPTLTPRERQIVSLLDKGYPAPRIAALLAVSPSTVRNHIHHVKTKLELGSRDDIPALLHPERSSTQPFPRRA